MDLGLKGKRAIVTGASRGIGKAVTRELASEGARVVMVARDEAALKAGADELSAEVAGAELYPVACDTGDDEQVRRMVARAADALGGVDILINGAGRPGNLERPPEISEITDETFYPDINVKVMGYLRCIREVVPYMRRQGGGRIINISGLSARHTGTTIHSMRNVSIVAMTKNLADELGPYGISLVVVHPAYIRTEATAGAVKARAQRDGVSEEEVERRLASESALGRLLDAREIAWVLTFLASPKAVSINGDTIAATGGTLGPIYY
jgi:NAD(P)-dependent dehydrogenase (short-subunit alcohol dehydrogenase family)